MCDRCFDFVNLIHSKQGTIMSDKQLNLDVDALLDGTLDDLADMPEFKPFPIGTHRCIINLERKKVNKDTAIEVKLTAKETMELPSGSDDKPLADGDNTNVLYFLTHENPQVAEMGQGGFKELMKVAAEKYGAKSNRDLMAELNGSEVLVVTGKRSIRKRLSSFHEH
jgi:hypothetical protein